MEAAEKGRRFALGVVSAVVGRLILWLVLEGRGERLLLRRKFAEAASVSAFEFLAADGVDGVSLIFGIDEAGAIVDVFDLVDVVDFGCFSVVFKSAFFIKVMVGCFCCILGRQVGAFGK